MDELRHRPVMGAAAQLRQRCFKLAFQIASMILFCAGAGYVVYLILESLGSGE